MLSTLRDKKTMQFVLWGLVVVFVATIFIAWGAGSTLSRNTVDPNLLAQVGNVKITYDDFNQVYQPELNRLYNIQGESPSTEQLNNLKKNILDTLIDNAILTQTAKKLGIQVSNEELAAAIQQMPYFKDQNGKFSEEKYLQILQANQLTPAQFESSEKSQMLLQKTQSLLTDAVIYTPDELADYTTLLDRDIKAEYISLNLKNYEKNITVDNATLNSYYQLHKSDYDRPEEIQVRHILLAPQNSDNPLGQDAAEKELEKFRNEILSGKATFAALAKKYSDDPGSKNQGGNLGWITRGEMVQPFEDQVFALKKGQISQPFETQYGYHIAQVTGIKKAFNSTFSSVRSQVLSDYKRMKANQEILAIASQLDEKIKSHETIAEAAKELGLNYSTTPWFSSGHEIPGLKGSKEFVQDLMELYPGDWGGPYSIGDNEYLFQIVDSRPLKNPKTPLDQQTIGQSFMARRQDLWMKDFLDQEKKTMKIKTYLNNLSS